MFVFRTHRHMLVTRNDILAPSRPSAINVEKVTFQSNFNIEGEHKNLYNRNSVSLSLFVFVDPYLDPCWGIYRADIL